MNRFEEITAALDQLDELESVDLVDLRKLMIEIEEFVNSEQYEALSVDQRSHIQEARKGNPHPLHLSHYISKGHEEGTDQRHQPGIF